MRPDDPRWSSLNGGRRSPYDPRTALRALELGDDSAWEELWDNLHHQDDVGEASYAAVPELVRIYTANPTNDWNAYSLVATIEDARSHPDSPPMPAWLEAEYRTAIGLLLDTAVKELPEAQADELVRSLLAFIALAKGQPLLAKAAFLTRDELEELLEA